MSNGTHERKAKETGGGTAADLFETAAAEEDGRIDWALTVVEGWAKTVGEPMASYHVGNLRKIRREEIEAKG